MKLRKQNIRQQKRLRLPKNMLMNKQKKKQSLKKHKKLNLIKLKLLKQKLR